MNTRRKGRKNELRAKQILEDAGYDVCLAPNPLKFCLENDLFGLWDLLAVSSTGFRAVQVKTNRKPSREYTEELAAWVCPPNCTKELWVFRDREAKPLIFVL